MIARPGEAQASPAAEQNNSGTCYRPRNVCNPAMRRTALRADPRGRHAERIDLELCPPRRRGARRGLLGGRGRQLSGVRQRRAGALPDRRLSRRPRAARQMEQVPAGLSDRVLAAGAQRRARGHGLRPGPRRRRRHAVHLGRWRACGADLDDRRGAARMAAAVQRGLGRDRGGQDAAAGLPDLLPQGASLPERRPPGDLRGRRRYSVGLRPGQNRQGFQADLEIS